MTEKMKAVADAVKPETLMKLMGGSEISLVMAAFLLILLLFTNPGEHIEATAYLDGGAMGDVLDTIQVILGGYFVGRPLSHAAKGYRAKANAEAKAHERVA